MTLYLMKRVEDEKVIGVFDAPTCDAEGSHFGDGITVNEATPEEARAFEERGGVVVKIDDLDIENAQHNILWLTEIESLNRDAIILEMLRLGIAAPPIDRLHLIYDRALRMLHERGAILCERVRHPDGREREIWGGERPAPVPWLATGARGPKTLGHRAQLFKLKLKKIDHV